MRGYISDHVTACSTTEPKIDPAPAVTKREGNALCYAAGYVCRYLRKKIECTKHDFKEEIVLCLMSLTKDTPEDHRVCASSEEWTLALGRGGLWHVKETTFTLFIAIEEVREFNT